MKTPFLCLVIIFLAQALLYPAGWEGYGLRVGQSTNDGTNTIVEMTDGDGHSFTVQSQDAVKDGVIDKIVTFKNEIFKWDGIAIASVRFFVTGGYFEVSVVPSALTVKGTNIAAAIPSGLYFYYDNNFRYDFRMTKDRMFMRVRGIYIDGGEMFSKMLRAYDSPVKYMQVNDPDYIYTRMVDLEETVFKLRSDVYLLQKEKSDLQSENGGLKKALINLMNRGFFGNVMVITDEKLKKVVGYKAANPSLTKDDILKKMQADKVDISDWEIYLILAVYFNEFKQ